jgi:tagaturonate reductase
MILQFGSGNFLRAFVDLFVSETAFDEVVVVQSTGTDRAEALNRARGRYHVAVQGLQDGVVVDRTVEVNSIRGALPATSGWAEVEVLACAPDLRWIVSNTTEAGFVLDDGEAVDGLPPRSFPAKLLRLLMLRYDAGLPGIRILPCELIEGNGDRLRALVLEQACRWGLRPALMDWITDGCHWANSLVDRIVPGPPAVHPLLGIDPLLVAAEPFALWAIESRVPVELPHPAILTVPDIGPYALRKIRILNGLHSALVSRAMPLGIGTVREAMEQPELRAWLEALLFEEIVPVLEGRVEDPPGFGRAVLERFENPFLEHRLSSIALHHDAKVRVRLRPTLEEYRARFGREPRILAGLV